MRLEPPFSAAVKQGANWQGLSDELAAIEFADVQELHVVFAISRVLGEAYSEQRYELERVANLEDLHRKILVVVHKIRPIAKKLDVAVSNRTHLLSGRSDMAAQALAFQSAHLEHSEKTLDQAKRYAAAANNAINELRELAARLTNPSASLESSVNEARALVGGIEVMDFKLVEIFKGTPAKLDYEVRMRSLIDTDGAFNSWSTELEAYRNFLARLLYCEDPRTLPEPVRTILKLSGRRQPSIAMMVWEGCLVGIGCLSSTSMHRCITTPAIGRGFVRRTRCSRPRTKQVHLLTGTMQFSCSYSRTPFSAGAGATT